MHPLSYQKIKITIHSTKTKKLSKYSQAMQNTFLFIEICEPTENSPCSSKKKKRKDNWLYELYYLLRQVRDNK